MTNTEAQAPRIASATAAEIPGLHPTTPENLSFAPSLEVRAFLLERERGNLLVYTTGRLDEDANALRARGGVTRQYLNHWHEAMLGLAPESLGAKLLHHSAEAPHIAEHGGRRFTFSRRHHLDEDFEVIPIPGHTLGATAYLWRTGGHRLLFSGDTIELLDGEWRTGLLASSDRDAYVQSLELLRDVEFDVLVPWATSVGGPYLSVVDQADRRARLDSLIERLRSSE